VAGSCHMMPVHHASIGWHLHLVQCYPWPPTYLALSTCFAQLRREACSRFSLCAWVPWMATNFQHLQTWSIKSCPYSYYDFIFNNSAQTTIPCQSLYQDSFIHLDYANLFWLLQLVSRDKTSLHYKVQIGSQADISTSMFQFQFQTHASQLIPAFQTSCTGHDHQHKSLITQNHSLQYQSLRYAAMYTTHDNFLVSFHKNLTCPLVWPLYQTKVGLHILI